MISVINSKYAVELLMVGKYPEDIARLMQCNESVIIQLTRNMSSEEKDSYIRNGFLRGEKYQTMADVLGISKPGVYVRAHRKLHLTEMDEAVRKHSKDLKLKKIKPKRYCKNCKDEISHLNMNAIYCRTCSNRCKQNDYYHKNKERYLIMQRRYRERKKIKSLEETI